MGIPPSGPPVIWPEDAPKGLIIVIALVAAGFVGALAALMAGSVTLGIIAGMVAGLVALLWITAPIRQRRREKSDSS